jgi:hypothetical protein
MRDLMISPLLSLISEAIHPHAARPLVTSDYVHL